MSAMDRDERTDRWQHLVSGAFSLDQAEQLPSAERRAQALAYLESVLEVFPSGLDPLEDFEGYAVRRAALSVLRALQSER